MKNIKRLLAIAILTIMSVPAVVNAYSVHYVGDYVNFYVSNAEKEANSNPQAGTNVGISAIAIANPDDANEKYLKSWIFGDIVFNENQYTNPDHSTYDNFNELKGKWEQNFKNSSFVGDLSEVSDTSKGMELLTKEEAMTVFGITGSCDTECTISNFDNFKGDDKLFGITLADSIYFANETGHQVKYLALADTAQNSMWAVQVDYTTSNDDIVFTGAKLKKITMEDAVYATLFIPVIYMDKEMNCHENTVKSLCYDCSGSYKWLTEGSSESTSCTPLPGKTQAECLNEACYDCSGNYKWFTVGQEEDNCSIIKSIDIKSKCVKPVKTGVEDYILEFLIIVSVAALVLFVVRKNDLFKTI